MTKQEKGNEMLAILKDIRNEKAAAMAAQVDTAEKAENGKVVDTDAVSQKRCPCCKAYYPATEDYFYKDRRTKTGLSYWCKVCKRADVARRKGRNPRPLTCKTAHKIAAVDTLKVVPIDFTGHDDLYDNLVQSAEEEFRTLDRQVLWMIKGYFDAWAS